MPIANLPADGDVRNTPLFRSVAPKLKNISVNKFIFELLRAVEDAVRNPHKHGGYVQGFNADTVNNLLDWSASPQNLEGNRFWYDVYKEETAHRNAIRRGGW